VNKSTGIPFLDLVTLHADLEDELCGVLKQTVRTAGFIGGLMVEGFEAEFATFCDAQCCVGVGSGTDALRFALVAAGVEPGAIVVTVPNTFIATTEAITQAGGIPYFVDVDERTYNMDPEKLREFLETECARDAISKRTFHKASGASVAAVVPVHLYGQMADMDSIMELAEHYHLEVIEDACQAHGAQYFSKIEQRWRSAGSIGKAAAFSFYPGKNLGACGEAGAITTNDAELAKRVRMLRDHGQSRKYFHDIEGYNGRLDSIQAGFLAVKLRHLAEWNTQRTAHAGRYNELLAEYADSIAVPYEPASSRAVYHLYVVRVAERDAVQRRLGAAGIGTAIHYPVPLHLQKAYQRLGYERGDFPIAEAVADRILSLPMFPSLTDEQQRRVVDELAAAASQVALGDFAMAVEPR
jgi:dTDP-4-amino-4,6-dideoxygalactose transaminase